MMETLYEEEARLNLPNINILHIKAALNLLIKYNTNEEDTKFAINLFFDIARKITELNNETAFNNEEKKTIGNLIAVAYDNLYTISTDTIPTNCDSDIPMKIQVWAFLKAIKENPSESYDKIKDEKFSIFPFLETIKMIFLLRDTESKLVFPIGDILHMIFESYQLFTHLNDEDRQTFFSIVNIALMVFKEEDESKYQELEKKINSFKLNFLLYGDNIIKIDQIQTNFKYNKVFIVVSPTQNKIYIHVDANNKDYFKGQKNLIEERNENNGYIFGYHIEQDWSNDEQLTSFDEELEKGDIEIKRSLLKILFDDNNYNILARNFLIKNKNNVIRPLNPYAAKDEYVILDDKQVQRSLRRTIFNKYFSKIIIKGQGMNALTFGTIYFLHECLPNKDITSIFDEINQSECLQNSALSAFINKYPEHFEDITMALYKEFSRVSDSKILFNIKPLEVLLYPIRPNLRKCLSDILKQEHDVDLAEYTIKHFQNKNNFPQKDRIHGDDFEDEDDMYLIKTGEEYYYYKKYQNLLYGLNLIQENQALIEENDILQNEHYKQLKSLLENATKLQWSHYYNFEKDVPLSIQDLTLMRLYYHAVAYTKHNKTALENLIDFLCQLTQIQGEALNNAEIQTLITSQNALVVCKNVSAYRNSMYDMLNKYVKINHMLPLPWAESLNIRKINSGKFAIDRGRGYYNIVDKVCFIFDNSLSGNSTANTLKQYFNFNNSYNFKLQEYKLCENNKTSLLRLSEIIKVNNIKDIFVIVLYWTKTAREEIEKTIDIINDKEKLAITPFFPKTNELKYNYHQIELANNIYGEDAVNKDCIYVFREFNQPKMNWLKAEEAFKPSSITSIALRKQ